MCPIQNKQEDRDSPQTKKKKKEKKRSKYLETISGGAV
jgi:hypothetical protein